MNVLDRTLPYSRIVVSGCQRSGTTVMAKMLAGDLRLKHVDEDQYGVDRTVYFRSFLATGGVVLQAPAMSHYLHMIGDENTIVIWMRRPLEEIRSSMNRIRWGGSDENREKHKYRYQFRHPIDYTRPIEEIKLDVWQNYQQPLMRVPWIEVPYDCDYMQDHPLYIAKEGRSGFHPKQTAPLPRRKKRRAGSGRKRR